MGAIVAGPDGVDTPVHMGSYGIGPTRVVAAIIEASHDDDGIIWPASVTPFDVALANLKPGDDATDAMCDDIETRLENAGLSWLHDDTDNRAGAKFATMDLIGLPVQIIVGPRGAKQGEVEIKNRASGERDTMSVDGLMSMLADRVA